MKDETYVFIQDVKEKASTARSARNRRTHNGKGGMVKLPSDYLTEKEKKAMSGEVKSYRLNDPMPWREFKAMPDDIKITYIKLLREKFDCSISELAAMMGIATSSLSRELKRLGFPDGKRGKRQLSEREAFYAWWRGVPVEAPVEETIVEEITEEAPVEVPEEPDAKPKTYEITRAIPCSGNMTFEGRIDEVLNTVSALLGEAKVHISITWDVL